MTMSTYKSYSSVPVQPANGDRVPVILYASFPPPRKEFNVWKFAFLVVLATFVSYTLLNCIAEDEDQYLREQEEALSQGGAFGRGRSSLLSYRGGVFDVIFGTNGENGANGVEDDSVDVSEHWFTEQVDDHFAADVARKHWEQKYYVNNGSIEGKQIKHAFLYICGEGPCTPSSIGNQLFMHDLATQQNALIVSLEHRFYGESYPTKDMSLESLRLLSSQQVCGLVGWVHVLDMSVAAS
ncbi:hypothetical protein SARC_12621 [Sphaeroforma arctica JP610]|uniref:Uncharacterized protein n=1 Tax=Sphaeroforma arctica JP610 TaxID=667725 RepID=A0A0L0FDK7_9EUKA|nr:hypothetical protein SARC_12621 [Sphaeroforma arctica JP610]KNC74840.1 hypothetical protein SARC_12621 [Sphaeroforma arctica JP610]|eukprot:XP_014148742.1 hypothetical protein SARC_12621 [Sphaeroforma arctica JP610]